tara:strand:+ start:2480 stop:2812 length:333 start_codon:yes stop_codon:yes gene_type:complete
MDYTFFENAMRSRLGGLGVRMRDIDHELSDAKPNDSGNQAVELEDDEVLEGIGAAAQKEVALLNAALGRIKDKTYGTCLSCGEAVSEARLDAVLYTPLCKTCASGATTDS